MNAPLNHPLPLLDLDVLAHLCGDRRDRQLHHRRQRRVPHASAVSMQIKKLEDILGRSVFSRDARSVTMTPDGEMLLGYARRLLAINREAVSKFIIPDISGVVRLGSPDDYGERVLPHVLKRFAQSHPSVAVDVIIHHSSNLRRRMDDRALDITLVTNSYKNSMAGAEVLLTEPIVWAGAKGGCAHLRGRCRYPCGRRVAPGAPARWSARTGRAQLPRRLYERPHRRPAFRDHGRPCGGAAAEILSGLRDGRAHPKDGLPEIGNYSLAMFVAPDASAPVKAAADHIRATFEVFHQTGEF